MRSWTIGMMAVVCGAVGAAACGSPTVPTVGDDTEVVATDFKTFPPPTTTIPPTTTLPPQPGSILQTEATYEVVSGDYPFVVADRFGVDFEEFVVLNGWTVEDGNVPEWPEPGTIIRIPAGATVPDGPSVLVPVGTVPPTDPTGTGVDGTGVDGTGVDGTGVPGTGESATGTSTADNGDGCGTYTIVEGDYLGRVATKLNTTVEAMAAANTDTDGYSAFYVGLVIDVPC